ncbi:MAG: hypothetical protein DWI57_08875 [Chloroflexi bacterium]|nr:MAG: hypothetical protein DWI57_08875 [Chloroflexota bacterium]
MNSYIRRFVAQIVNRTLFLSLALPIITPVILCLLLLTGSSQAAATQRVSLHNTELWLDFDVTDGIGISRIHDVVTGHNFLNGTRSLFELAPDNDGLPCPGNGDPLQSNNGLTLDRPVAVQVTSLVVSGYVTRMPTLTFTLAVNLPASAKVATLRLEFTNLGTVPVCVRSVFPKIIGLIAPGDASKTMGVVPTEIGGVAPLASTLGMTLGMPFSSTLDLDVGLPRSMNPIEVATIFDPDGGGGLYFADVDGDPDAGVPTLQFTLSAKEVDGFWVGEIPPGSTVNISRLAIGVYHTGDWHEAVDYWLQRHRGRIRFPAIPDWLRNQSAIYSFAGGGAGGIYLDLPGPPLANGQLITSFEVNDGSWTDKPPLPLTTANFAPPAAHISGIARNPSQEDVFLVANDGSVQTLFEYQDGPWSDPIALTGTGFTRPGGYTAPVKRNASQEDIFFIGTDNQVWTVFEINDGPWSQPIQLSTVAGGLVPAGGGLAAISRNDHQEDVFVVGHNGAIWTLFELNDGPWSAPIQVTSDGFAIPGQPLTAVKRNARQEDLFICGSDGTLWTLFELNDGAFSDPIRLTRQGFCPPGAPVAALMRNDRQEDVFVVDTEGAIWTLFQVNNGAFSEPIRLTDKEFTVAGAHLSAVVRNDRQEDIFVVDKHGGAHTLFVLDDGPWSEPKFIGPAHLPPGAPIGAVTRNSRQVDVFALSSGRINSFLDLPQLLDEARQFGTNVVYLWDYWEGTKAGGFPPYWNKGDYKPRADLGGEQALIEGIRRLHEKGGRIILYIEPFITYRYSEIGMKSGGTWEAWDATGPMLSKEPYKMDYYKMVVPDTDWQDYLIRVGRQLVGPPLDDQPEKSGYGADGILLDSGGWQLNWPVQRGGQGPFFSSAQYTQGFFNFVDRLRAALQEINADAVVLGETTSGPVAGHWDGGFSADFSFNRNHSGGKILGSPVRYGLPQVNFMSNGLNLNELHQIYAAGHGLALCCYFPGNFLYDNAADIWQIVKIRQDHADALIYGTQSYQPSTERDDVVAYFYHGSNEDVITVVNTSEDTPYDGILVLRGAQRNTTWLDLMSGKTFQSQNQQLPLTLPPVGLRVLVQEFGTPLRIYLPSITR